MKKVILLLLTAVTLAVSCTTHTGKDQSAHNKAKKVCRFICTMDKDVCADKPGVCPKCGMTLVENETDE